MKIIELSIQEIVQDYYNLAETEGYLSGLCEVGCCEEKDLNEYFFKMKKMIEKYIPNYKKHVDERYFEEDITLDEKGVILSEMLCNNFKEIFYKLV